MTLQIKLIWGLILCSFPLMGQTYQNPVPQIGNTSGLFGELRGNHFHSGIDYPTFGDGKTPILAVYNGHVSRIKISATGYGNALYIKHPTGYTSVYAHLHSFNQKIAQWVKAKQYQLESFEMDVFPNETELQIVKGEIIGLGGNTGNSTGPHLHFEMRNSRTEWTCHPLHFGFSVSDRAAPTLNSLQLVEIPGHGYSEQFLSKKTIYGPNIGNLLTHPLQLNGKFPHASKPVTISHPAYIELKAADIAAIGGASGIHRITILENSDTLFDFKIDSFSFADSRYINSLIDFSSGAKSYRCQRSPGNLLPCIRAPKNNGLILPPKDGETKEIQVWCRDFYGNAVGRGFVVAANNRGNHHPNISPRTHGPNKAIALKDLYAEAYLDPWTLYDSISPDWQFLNPTNGTVSQKEIRLFNSSLPAHKLYRILLLADHQKLKPSLRSKTVLECLGKEGKKSYHTGSWDQDWFESSLKVFGRLRLVLDTIKPTITSSYPAQPIRISRGLSIIARINDQQSGIKEYRVTVNNRWILAAYDAKSDLLSIPISKEVPLGKQNILIKVTDHVGNSSSHTVAVNIQN